MSEDKDRLAELQKQLDAVQNTQAEIESQLGGLPGPSDGSTALPDDRLASEATSDEVERARVLRDPWAGTNAMEILRHPPGKRLRWINPETRKQSGMRGYTPVRHGDAIGRELPKYIKEPPSRMEGLAEISEVVRRGDVVLAWIDEGIARAREQANRDKINRTNRSNADWAQREYGQHGRTTGPGLRDDPDPSFRARPRRGIVSQERLDDYRSRAKGTAKDPQIRVSGRRMFDDSQPAPQE